MKDVENGRVENATELKCVLCTYRVETDEDFYESMSQIINLCICNDCREFFKERKKEIVRKRNEIS